jgi:hypothetical protein
LRGVYVVCVVLSLLILACALAGCGRYELAATWNEVRGDAYALDDFPRDLAEGAAPGCPAELPTVTYRGEIVAYAAPVQVAEPFVAKLREFEQLVAAVSTEHYGRPPDRLVHFGARACRTVRGNVRRLSEHALGNALDLSGFEWKRARGAERYPKAFSVSVLRHWTPLEADANASTHQQFLRELVARVDENDVFRGIVGPGREGHANHLHFDQAPWSYTLF